MRLPRRRSGTVAGSLFDERETASRWQSILVCAAILVICGLVVYATRVQGKFVFVSGIYSGAALLLTLILFQRISEVTNDRRQFAALRVAYSDLDTKYAALSEVNQRLQMLATTDALTELPNQRAVAAALDQEIERGRRYGRKASIVFVDLDHFKRVNDEHGHIVGDAVLQEVARVAHNSLRAVDVLGRWGGEEFVAILPEVEPRGAMAAAHRMQEAIAGHVFHAAPCRLTASVGIASFPEDGDSRVALLAAADRAMYSEKAGGRTPHATADAPDSAAPAAGDHQSSGTALERTVEGLSAMMASRAHYPSSHKSNVSELVVRIADAYGLASAQTDNLALASRLHDIGKVAVPDAVLLKPGSLNDDEWMLMRRHPIVGADLVARIHGLEHLAAIIRSHHERWDGLGYPDGLARDEIPIGARILAVADAFEAMTQGRSYQEAHDPEWALNELRRCAGSQFDPKVVDAVTALLAPEIEAAATLQAV